ncbi:ABC transporter substrate-binding protein [Nocardiopsis sediminis]|uniref:ABC transporter substrate-binding protein n=1 Tax=Nocardiopsis sediminis TaxID=1778267 RepID=A0ABV8FUI0_9ACTN
MTTISAEPSPAPERAAPDADAGAGAACRAAPLRRLVAVAAAGALLATAAGCAQPGGGTPAEGAADTAAQSCPAPPTPDDPPERVVTLDGGSAAILAGLGLADRIVGTADTGFFDPFEGEEAQELSRIPVLEDGQAGRELVIAAEPDLVMGIHPFQFGSFDGTPTVAELRAAGSDALVACPASGTVTGIDGTLEFIGQTAEVFGVPERGEELAERVASDADAAAPPSGTAPVRVLMVSDAPQAGRPIGTLGAASPANGVITRAGGENIAGDIEQELLEVSPEEVVARDPEAIVVLTGFSTLSGPEIADAVRADPVLSRTTAVREDRFAVLPQSIAVSPSVLNGRAVAAIAETLHATA